MAQYQFSVGRGPQGLPTHRVTEGPLGDLRVPARASPPLGMRGGRHFSIMLRRQATHRFIPVLRTKAKYNTALLRTSYATQRPRTDASTPLSPIGPSLRGRQLAHRALTSGYFRLPSARLATPAAGYLRADSARRPTGQSPHSP